MDLIRIKKQFILIILLSVGPLCSIRAQSADSLQVQLSRKWMHSKTYALKLAASMPEQYYDFKPVPVEMSFKEQLLHLADNIQWLASSYLLVPALKDEKDLTNLTKADVLKIVGDAYDIGLKAHQSVSPARLNEIVSFFAGNLTRRQILILMHDHQTHHLGQLIVYLRLKGISPPEYVGW